jgi:hypothetical protein
VLDAIQADCGGWVEFRALPSRAQCFARRGDTATLSQFVGRHRDTQDLYWAIATRKDSTSGRTENCQQIGCLFADLDFASHSEDRLRGCLDGFVLQPSVVIHSGAEGRSSPCCAGSP